MHWCVNQQPEEPRCAVQQAHIKMPSDVMEKFTGGYSREGFRWKIVRWITSKNCPYSIVEDEELVEIFKTLNGKVEIPSAMTVSRDICDVHRLMHVKLVEVLKVSVISC